MKTLLQWVFEQVKDQIRFSDVQIFFESNQITFWYRNEKYVLTLSKSHDWRAENGQ